MKTLKETIIFKTVLVGLLYLGLSIIGVIGIILTNMKLITIILSVITFMLALAGIIAIRDIFIVLKSLLNDARFKDMIKESIKYTDEKYCEWAKNSKNVTK